MDIFTISTIPRRQKRPDLTRDQRIQCLTLRTLNWSYPKIADHIKRHYGNDISTRQVRTACAQGHPTPEKRSGQPMKLSDAQVELIITYVSESQEHRLLSFQALAEGPFAHFNVSKDTIRRAFFKRGYQCYPITSKPPLSEKNRRIRLEFALTHGEWTLEQWLWVFWTDETWVRPGSHKRRYVIRRADEGLDPTCVIEKIRKSKGWMFWGSFNGGLKGPSIFWEKDWGMISANTYQAHVVPVIAGWLQIYPGLIPMQDNAPGHAARATIEDFLERGIIMLEWPPFSPDLNPIENLWNWMKDYLERTYGTSLHVSYDELRRRVQEAWEAIPNEILMAEVESMPRRMQAVIDANGGHTKY